MKSKTLQAKRDAELLSCLLARLCQDPAVIRILCADWKRGKSCHGRDPGSPFQRRSARNADKEASEPQRIGFAVYTHRLKEPRKNDVLVAMSAAHAVQIWVSKSHPHKNKRKSEGKGSW